MKLRELGDINYPAGTYRYRCDCNKWLIVIVPPIVEGEPHGRPDPDGELTFELPAGGSVSNWSFDYESYQRRHLFRFWHRCPPKLQLVRTAK